MAPQGSELMTSVMAQPSRRTVLLALAAIVLLSTLLDILFFTGFVASDDIMYFSGSVKLLRTGRLWDLPQPGEVRLFMLAWGAVAAWLARYDVQLVAASFIVFHQLLNVFVYRLAARLFGVAAGLVAAYGTGTFPLLVTLSSTILPDLPVACLLCAAVVTLHETLDRQRLVALALGMATAGIAVGVGYLAKESALIPLPLLLAYVALVPLFRRGPGRPLLRAVLGVLGLSAGVLLVIMIERVLVVHIVGAAGGRFAWGIPAFDASVFARLPERWVALASQVSPRLASRGALFLVGGATIAVVAVARRGLFLVLLTLWYVGFYLVGSASFQKHELPNLQVRYLIPCLPFAIAVAAGAVVAVGRALGTWLPARFRVRVGIPVAIVALAATSLAGLRGVNRAAGRIYLAPLAGNARQLVDLWSLTGRAPLVLSSVLSAHVYPLYWRSRPPTLLFSNEVDARLVDRWLAESGFYFAELDQGSWILKESKNPILHWRYSLIPASPGFVEEALQPTIWSMRTQPGLVVREVARFDARRDRLEELRAGLGLASIPSAWQRTPEQAVTLYRVVAPERDRLLAHQLGRLPEHGAPPVVNAAFDAWRADVPAGWQASGPTARTGASAVVQVGPCSYCYVWQSTRASALLAGRVLRLDARARAKLAQTTRLWLKAERTPGDWVESFGDWHPGDGAWHELAVRLPLPLDYSGGELRIVLMHWNDEGNAAAFDDVRLTIAEP
jgi:hypothetical protein